jgi:hypothetical protein
MGDGGVAPAYVQLPLEGGGWSAPCASRFMPEKDPVLTVEEAGWSSGPDWRVQSSDCPVHVESCNTDYAVLATTVIKCSS